MNKTLTTIRWPGWRPVSMAVFAVTLIAFSSPGFAAKGGDPGPPVGGETPNNLSLPSIQTELQPQPVSPLHWLVPEDAQLGVHYSYGCDAEEGNEQFSYPNTSCVNSLDDPTIYYTAAECIATGMPCEGLPVDRIYWQKVDVNDWWADDDGIATPTSRGQAHVAYIDWGDALEAVSWNERSVIRVETQPYSSTIPGFNPAMQSCEQAATVAEDDCKIGFQMWHVAGQGITEHWGVRANDEAQAVSYNYDSPFQIIKSTTARINLTKMVPVSATCSMPGGNPGDEPPIDEIGQWSLGNEPGDANWGDTCTLYDELYSIETSVGGKYVYGYNWRMRDVLPEDICGWEKTGFWRLTFYTPSPSNEVPAILFDDAEAPNVAPPAVLTAVRELPRTWFIDPPVIEPEPETVIVMSSDDEDPDADDRLYRPVVDTVNNLTYIDICVVAKEGGGGGGGGGGGPGGGGGGGGHVADSTADSTADSKGGGIGGGIGGGRDASKGVGGGIGGGRDANRGKGGKH